jgi:hypothetical protein
MATGFINRIAGLIRFSYPGLSGFQRKDDSLAALEARLYARARLERRFHFLEKLALPSLIAQTDRDFETLVLIGTSLPQWALDRLSAALSRLPGGRIVALPPLHHYPATQRAFDSLDDKPATHLTSFRLDDDDAMDRHHIARLRQSAEALASVVDLQTPFVIGHNKGLFLDLTGDRNTLTEVVEKLPLGIGLALTAPVGSRENIFRRNHRLVPQFFTTFTDAQTPAFIRTIHSDNDSSAHPSGVVRTPESAELDRILTAHFPFSNADLMAL